MSDSQFARGAKVRSPKAPSPSGSAWVVLFYLGYSGWSRQFHEGRVRAVRAAEGQKP